MITKNTISLHLRMILWLTVMATPTLKYQHQANILQCFEDWQGLWVPHAYILDPDFVRVLQDLS